MTHRRNGSLSGHPLHSSALLSVSVICTLRHAGARGGSRGLPEGGRRPQGGEAGSTVLARKRNPLCVGSWVAKVMRAHPKGFGAAWASVCAAFPSLGPTPGVLAGRQRHCNPPVTLYTQPPLPLRYFFLALVVLSTRPFGICLTRVTVSFYTGTSVTAAFGQHCLHGVHCCGVCCILETMSQATPAGHEYVPFLHGMPQAARFCPGLWSAATGGLLRFEDQRPADRNLPARTLT